MKIEIGPAPMTTAFFDLLSNNNRELSNNNREKERSRKTDENRDAFLALEAFITLAALGFFTVTGERYQIVIPPNLDLETVKRRFIELAAGAEAEIALEELIITMPCGAAIRWRKLLVTMDCRP